MSSQLQKYLQFNSSRPRSRNLNTSLIQSPRKIPRLNIYYGGSSNQTSRATEISQGLSQINSRLSQSNSFKRVSEPINRSLFHPSVNIRMNKCAQPTLNQKQKLKMIEEKRRDIEKLRKSISLRKINLQEKYDQLLKRSKSIKQFYMRNQSKII